METIACTFVRLNSYAGISAPGFPDAGYSNVFDIEIFITLAVNLLNHIHSPKYGITFTTIVLNEPANEGDYLEAAVVFFLAMITPITVPMIAPSTIPTIAVV